MNSKPSIYFIAINAQYSHTSLSVRSLYSCCVAAGLPVSFREYTINQSRELILRDIFSMQPELLAFSCYLWNIELIKSLIPDLKTVLPACRFVIGGPEVSFRAKEMLDLLPIDAVQCGEGEVATVRLVSHFLHQEPWTDVPGLVFRNEGRIVRNAPHSLLSLDSCPFPYDELKTIKGRILYYESSRGCPFHCSYCLSGSDNQVRTKSIDLVKQDLSRFLDEKVLLVKFVDRTFNFDRRRSDEIWLYCMEHDNGATRFHFEIAADLLDEDNFKVLSKARPGLFQFEIGVQTTNPDTLNAIHRNNSNEKIFNAVKRIHQECGIHCHLDLIAGLPMENYDSFRRSFNAIYEVQPEQLQLGFLKVLSGSQMERESCQYGIQYSKVPPYEVLCTDCLSYRELCSLKRLEEMLERYYNSGKYVNTLSFVVPKFSSPFDFFRGLSEYSEKTGFYEKDHTRVGYLDHLHDFLISNGFDEGELENVMRLDWCLHEKPNTRPSWMCAPDKDTLRRFLDYYLNPLFIQKYLPSYTKEDGHRIARITHMDYFLLNGKKELVIFDYRVRSITGNASIVIVPKNSTITLK